MITYEDKDVIAKPSSIHGIGLFAKRPFKKGEVVTEWDAVKLVPEDKFSALTYEEKKYTSKINEHTYAVIGIPARYVNHSNNPNTKGSNGRDIATRDIKPGEEITADYRAEGAFIDFEL